jgi:SpoIIAA-like
MLFVPETWIAGIQRRIRIWTQSMSFTYSIDPGRRLLVHVWTGQVTLIALRQLVIAVRNDPLYRPQLNVLADFREADANIAHEDMMSIARFAGDRNFAAKHAIVVKRQMELGMARMYELMSESVARGQMRIFKDIEEAHAWFDGSPRTATTMADSAGS